MFWPKLEVLLRRTVIGVGQGVSVSLPRLGTAPSKSEPSEHWEFTMGEYSKPSEYVFLKVYVHKTLVSKAVKKREDLEINWR